MSRKSQCRHRQYLMDCDDYAALWNRADGRCEMCRCLPKEANPPALFIDHDPMQGRWAVRGLLCNICNVSLGNPRRSGTDLARQYLSCAWHLGLGPCMDEPVDVGTILRGRWGGSYTKTPLGWSRSHWHVPRGWLDVLQAEGPYLRRAL